MNEELVRSATEDLTEAVNLMHQVIVPDYLDFLAETDWELVISLRAVERALNQTIQLCYAKNRAIIEASWVGGSTASAPLGLVKPLPPEPEG